jgi:hypothetical protein
MARQGTLAGLLSQISLMRCVSRQAGNSARVVEHREFSIVIPASIKTLLMISSQAISFVSCQILMMGTEMVHKVSVICNWLTYLIAQENFINLAAMKISNLI